MKKRFSLLLLAVGLTPSLTQAQWVSRTSVPGTGRGGCYSFVLNGVAYVGGGDQQTGSANDLWAYDPTTDTWNRRADLPADGRAVPGVFVIGSTAYVVGGENSNGTQIVDMNDVWAYDATLDRWTARAPLPATGRAGAYAFTIGGRGYLGGGTNISNGGQQTDFWAYEPAADRWTARPAPPSRSTTLSASFALGGAGYVGGGINFDSLTNSSQPISRAVWRYDAASNQWSRRANLPGPRAYASGFTAGGYGYAVEGLSDVLNQTVTMDMLRFDPVADTWTSLVTAGGLGRVAPYCFALNGDAYVGGGVEPGGSGFLNDFWMLPNLITGVAAPVENATLALSPNPAHTTARLTLPAPAPQAELLDALGRLVRRVALPAGGREADLDLTGLPPGLYSVRAGGLTRRLVVE